MKRKGWKLLRQDADGNLRAFHGFTKFEAGGTVELPPGEFPVLCSNGFHFCPNHLPPLACLQFVPLADDTVLRLAIVKVPNRADVVHDKFKLAASRLTVVSVLSVDDTLAALSGVFDDGSRTRWYHQGKLHRDDDLPAVEWTNGSKEWRVHGKRHRDGDKPAVELADGSLEWWMDGELHRDGDKPAIVWSDGHQEWWVHGRRHPNRGLPAVSLIW